MAWFVPVAEAIVAPVAPDQLDLGVERAHARLRDREVDGAAGAEVAEAHVIHVARRRDVARDRASGVPRCARGEDDRAGGRERAVPLDLVGEPA